MLIPAARRLGTGAVLLLLLLTGCGESATSRATSAPYVEPGWMADVRAQTEEYEAAFVACLRGQGQDVEPGAVAVRVPTDAEGRPLPGAVDSARTANQHCAEQVSDPAFYGSVDLGAEYERLLDVRDCLHDQGHVIPDPPSKDAWIEVAARDQGDWWAPYAYFGDPNDPETNHVTPDEMRALIAVCTPSLYTLISVAD